MEIKGKTLETKPLQLGPQPHGVAPSRVRIEGGLGNVCGAFADTGLLLPLIALLAASAGFSAPRLLASAGLAYIAAAWVFRIPMPVQPLKSIAVAAVAIGASRAEVTAAGALLGLVCLTLSFCRIEVWANRVPKSLIHGIQAGLGLFLMRQGVKALMPLSGEAMITGYIMAIVLALTAWKSERPVLGIVATLGLLAALITRSPSYTPNLQGFSSRFQGESIRWGLVASLLLPQLALTGSNSVLATVDVAQHYLGVTAKRVTSRRLLGSIGVGNLLSAVVGGMPFCHGSGGLTAHYRGGSRHWASNIVIGSCLLMLAIAASRSGRFQLSYPPVILAALLISIGVLHLDLARPSLSSPRGLFIVISMGLISVASGSLLFGLIAGIACLALQRFAYTATYGAR